MPARGTARPHSRNGRRYSRRRPGCATRPWSGCSPRPSRLVLPRRPPPPGSTGGPAGAACRCVRPPRPAPAGRAPGPRQAGNRGVRRHPYLARQPARAARRPGPSWPPVCWPPVPAPRPQKCCRDSVRQSRSAGPRRRRHSPRRGWRAPPENRRSRPVPRPTAGRGENRPLPRRSAGPAGRRGPEPGRPPPLPRRCADARTGSRPRRPRGCAEWPVAGPWGATRRRLEKPA